MSDLRELISELPQSEFDSLLYWILNEEREDRKVRQRAEEFASEAQVRQIQELRKDGVLVQPEPLDEYLAGEIYLPGETAVHAEEVWGVISTGPTKQEPGVSPDWEVVPVSA